MKKPILTAALLFMVPPLVLAQNADHQYRGQGYIFFAPGATSPATVHLGGGGEAFVYRALGLGVEVGYAAEWSHFAGRYGGVGIGSADVSYHFRPRTKDSKLEPFVAGGYTLFFLHGHTGGVNFGAGVNVWVNEHAALRLEIRDNVGGEDVNSRDFQGHQHLVGFRIGLTFR